MADGYQELRNEQVTAANGVDYAYRDTGLRPGNADAMAAAERATRDAYLYNSMRTLPELIEAAVRTGNTRVADRALGRLAETTHAGGTRLRARARSTLTGAAGSWRRR